MSLQVTSYCIINNKSCNINGLEEEIKEDQLDDFLSTLFKSLGIKYSKFYKMDRLSKLGLIGVEMLSQKNESLKNYQDDEIAMLFMNADSSLDTDIKHQKTLDEKKNPSPAIFVYTLPNILMGEVSILKKWYGENLFILADQFKIENWLNEVQVLFDLNKAKAVIGGWINVMDQKIDLRLFLVENNSEKKSFKIEELSTL